MSISTSTYQVYELEDPREPDIPRWVGYGVGAAPWQSLWDFRHHGTGPLFDWLRELDAEGLEPVVSEFFRLGRSKYGRLSGDHARTFARMRIDMICRAVGGHPDFLLNPPLGLPDPCKPIIAESDAGEWDFASVGHAVEHGFTRSAIYEALEEGTTYKGFGWRYADGVETGRNQRPVERIASEGTVERFSSVYGAARATGFSRRYIARLIETAESDREGCYWRDAQP